MLFTAIVVVEGVTQFVKSPGLTFVQGHFVGLYLRAEEGDHHAWSTAPVQLV